MAYKYSINFYLDSSPVHAQLNVNRNVDWRALPRETSQSQCTFMTRATEQELETIHRQEYLNF